MTEKDKTATDTDTDTATAACSKAMKGRAKEYADDHIVPSSTGLDRDDCMFIRGDGLPSVYQSVSKGYLRSGTPVAIPTKILDGLANQTRDYLAVVSAISHGSPTACFWSLQTKSLFLKWHIRSDDGVRAYDDWVGARVRAWKGALAITDLYLDAEKDAGASDWARALRHQGAEARFSALPPLGVAL
jgi:hypothetical protein